MHWTSYLVQISHDALKGGTNITICIYEQGNPGPEDSILASVTLFVRGSLGLKAVVDFQAQALNSAPCSL